MNMKTKITIDNPLPPLWLMYPTIPRFSVRWRMGYGEAYASLFNDWYIELSPDEQQKYQTMFPAPHSWREYYADVCKEVKDESFFRDGISFWQPDGVPKYSLEQLKTEVGTRNTFKYLFFWGHHPKKEIDKSCFSQWWTSSFQIDIHDYCCMEQYMMAEKARLFEDNEIRKQILNESDPKAIKALGRKVCNFDPVIWDKYKYSIVLNGNYAKFIQNEELLRFLLNTGDKILVEASPYDKVWGIGMQESDPRTLDPSAWKGDNLLGFALTEVREELKWVTHSCHLVDWDKVKKENDRIHV